MNLYLGLAIFWAALLVAGVNDIVATTPKAAVVNLPVGAPLEAVQPGDCDFGREGRNTFRCGPGAGAVIEMSDGRRVFVPGPLSVTFGRI